MYIALLIFPLVMAAAAFAIRSDRFRPFLLPAAAVCETAMLLTALAVPELSGQNQWLSPDPPAKVISLGINFLYLFSSFYAAGYLRYRQERSSRVFVVCLLLFPAAAALVVLAKHLGLMWIAIEATTLITAPLIYFNRSKFSIEATWKYLMVSSVGIALALLGTFLLAYSELKAGMVPSLMTDDLLARAPELSVPWLRAAFILLLIGYGAKMGLSPMHTWKPDAYGEAPGVVGAILAGGVTSCAFLAFLRIWHIASSAGQSEYTSGILIFMGIFSMATAAVYMLGQKDFKRMLAYSSVEQMGILITGLGIGPAALFPVLFHTVANALTKGVMFLSAGNIHRAYGSKTIDKVRGSMNRLPVSSSLFMAGFLAIAGTPPFAPFIGEFGIVSGAVSSHHYLTAGLFLLMLFAVFIGMLRTVIRALFGTVPEDINDSGYRDGVLTAVPVLLMMTAVLLLGIWMPEPFLSLINEAVTYLEAGK